jgi:hypothetical protein
MTYSFNTTTGEVIRDRDGKVVAPCQSADDADFVEYNNWASAGNFPTLIQAIVPVPVMIVEPLQIRKALTRLGIRAQVEEAVGTANQDVKDMWEFSPAIYSNDPTLVQFATALGLDIGAVFALAETL